MKIDIKTPRLFGRQAVLTLGTRIALRNRGGETFYTPESVGALLMVANHRTNRIRMLGVNRYRVMDLRA